MTLDWRTYRDRDLPGIAALLAEALPYDRPSAAYVRYLLADDPGFRPDLTWVAADGESLAGFVAAALPDERLQCPGGLKLFAVSPEHRRMGVATRLFGLAEGALRAQGVSECVAVNCGNHRLSLGVDVRYTAAVCLLLARGYAQTGTTQDMTVDLSAASGAELSTEADETRLRASGIAVRRAKPDERPWVCAGVARTMVAPTPRRRWAYLAEQAFRRDPPTIEIAEDTRTGGFVGFAAYDAARWQALGPMGVAPAAQRLGLGSVLLRRCLRDMRADGYRRGEIFSVGPIPFYAKSVGASITRVFYRYAKSL